MRRIGVLMNLAASDAEGQARIAALLQGLERLGWVPGRNVRIDTRWAAGSPDNFRAYARELLALEPEVIVGVATPAVTALQQAVAAYRSCSSASRRTGGGWRRAPCSTFRACAHGTGPRALRQCARKSGRAMVDSRVESKLIADVGAFGLASRNPDRARHRAHGAHPHSSADELPRASAVPSGRARLDACGSLERWAKPRASRRGRQINPKRVANNCTHTDPAGRIAPSRPENSVQIRRRHA